MKATAAQKQKFEFTQDNAKKADAIVKKYPEGKYGDQVSDDTDYRNCSIKGPATSTTAAKCDEVGVAW